MGGGGRGVGREGRGVGREGRGPNVGAWEIVRAKWGTTDKE